MREYKFRGLDAVMGIWRYGSLTVLHDFFYHFPEHEIWLCNEVGYRKSYSVNPETVGQYIGLTDENGKEIYEGDFVKFRWGNGENDKGEVIFLSGCFVIHRNGGCGILNLPLGEFSLDCEIIGNIHEHPHLLKEEPPK